MGRGLSPSPNVSSMPGIAPTSFKSAAAVCSCSAIIPCQETNFCTSDPDPIFFPLSNVIENAVVTEQQTHLLDKCQSIFKCGISSGAACDGVSLHGNMVPLHFLFHSPQPSAFCSPLPCTSPPHHPSSSLFPSSFKGPDLVCTYLGSGTESTGVMEITRTAAAVSLTQAPRCCWVYVLSVSLSDLSPVQLSFNNSRISLEIACTAVQVSFVRLLLEFWSCKLLPNSLILPFEAHILEMDILLFIVRQKVGCFTESQCRERLANVPFICTAGNSPPKPLLALEQQLIK